MNETVNTALSSLSSTFGSAVESLATIGTTVVQETSDIGFTYIVVGLSLIVVGILFLFAAIKVARNWGKWFTEKDWKEGVVIWLSIIAAAFVALGIGLATANLPSWVSPTKEVAREIISRL